MAVACEARDHLDDCCMASTHDTANTVFRPVCFAALLQYCQHPRYACRCNFSLAPQPHFGHKRVLRYPDGLVRTIRYPEQSLSELLDLAQAAGTADAAAEQDTDVDAPGWVICGETDAGCQVAPDYDFEEGLPGAAPTGALWVDELELAEPEASAAARSNHDAHSAHTVDSYPLSSEECTETLQSDSFRASSSTLPDSPAAFLRYVQSDEYKRQQQSEAAQVQDSFTVLTSCPWVLPRQLSVLALAQDGSEHPTMYTLPTSIAKVRIPLLPMVRRMCWCRSMYRGMQATVFQDCSCVVCCLAIQTLHMACRKGAVQTWHACWATLASLTASLWRSHGLASLLLKMPQARPASETRSKHKVT